MRKKIIYPLLTFLVIFALHVVYSIWNGIQLARQWVQIEEISWITLYLERQDYLLGISYGLAGGFTIYAFFRFLETRQKAVSGVVGGLTLTGLLYFGGCFLLGCCGSPLLAVYLSLFGSSFLGFTKPFVLILTALSLTIGYFWLNKKKQSSSICCTVDEKSKGEVL
ncbi:MAG: hypothetical protein IEMM0008_1757 [bacterium]|nr:MAG: hypothetical protein IEMM0008_1757 [bacterium]